MKKCRRKYDPMRILEAIFYLLRSGCQWRLLPPCYPHWKSVYNKWRYWNAIGIFLRILSFLIRYSRNRSGRNEMPAICFIDSASRRSGLSDSVKGIDGFKKIKGIKRHLIVDSQGNILHIHTTCANVNDGKVCLEMLSAVKGKYPTLKEIRADKGYRGEDVIEKARQFNMKMVCTKSNGGGSTFIPAQGRWLVERSFSWLDNCRRLVRNYERECSSASDMVIAADIYRLLRFL
ncbi:MAG: IS5 family transposase [Muribaculaceae bacterium]|nr:IS5 family transposase [Muribaculaceae bacterium]